MERKIWLDDGSAIVIRPARAGDEASLQAMHDRLSPDTLYFRYFRLYRPTHAEFVQICRLERGAGGAFVASLAGKQETLIGIAYYIVQSGAASYAAPTIAEPAFLIEDRFQGQGIGRRLFQQVCRHAQVSGVQAFHAYVHHANRPMMRIFRTSGYPLDIQNQMDSLEVRLDLSTITVSLQRSWLDLLRWKQAVRPALGLAY